MADPKINIILGAKDDASSVVKGLRGQFDKFKKDAVTGFGLGAGISIFGLAQDALRGVSNIMGDAIGAASAMQETQSKLDAVFIDSADIVREWGEDAAMAMGMSEQAALDAAGDLGALFQAMGATEEAATDMSMGMVTLASDLASFFDKDPSEALVAMRSGMSGMTAPMKAFGVDVSAAAVETFLLGEGIEKVNGKFTVAQKMMGRYGVIMEQTTKAQGDFTRTSDGLANSQRQLAATLDDAMADIGEALIPVVTDLTTLAATVIPAVIDAVGYLGVAIGDLGSAFFGQTKLTRTEEAAVRDLAEVYGLDTAAVVVLMNAKRELAEERKQAEAAAENEQTMLENLALAWGATTSKVDAHTMSTEELIEAYKDHVAWEEEVRTASEAQRSASEALTDETLEAVSVLMKVAAAQKLFADMTKVGTGAMSIFKDTEDEATASTEALAEAQKLAKERAEVLADAIEHVAETSFGELKKAAKETQEQLKAAFEQPIPSIRKLRNEDDKLTTQRRRAMKAGRFDIVAMIDQRKAEIAQQIRQRQMVNRHYRAERSEQRSRRQDMQLLRGQFGLSKSKAKELRAQLVATFGKQWRTKVDRTQLQAAINKALALGRVLNSLKTALKISLGLGGGKAAGGPVSAGQTYLVGERGPELLQMGASGGNIVPNHRLSQAAPTSNGGVGDVYLDGFLVGRVIDERLGRQYATDARVSTYRRSS